MDSKVGAEQGLRAYSETKRQSQLMGTSTWNLLGGLIVPLAPNLCVHRIASFACWQQSLLDTAFSERANPDLGRMLTPPVRKMVFLHPQTSIPFLARATIQPRT